MTNGDIASQFREKTAFMRAWKPSNTPSNRDRLELYALHKQALSGDAPENMPCPTATDRSKLQAWKTKRGISCEEAMRLYLQESDRQLRVYGSDNGAVSTAQTPQNTPNVNTGSSASQPRGLAAIPLLCAAASESRQAYLTRLAHTSSSWWSRQEALCAAPQTVGSLPETLLLFIATGVEHMALHWGKEDGGLMILPSAVLQSILWPLHHTLLCLWMGLIVVLTSWGAAWDLATTTVWGTRRTGHTLIGIWKDAIELCAQSVHVLTESHQPVGARVVGLFLSPYPLLVQVSQVLIPYTTNDLVASVLYIAALMITWWYWVLVLPWIVVFLLWVSMVAGGCFGLIELASV